MMRVQTFVEERIVRVEMMRERRVLFTQTAQFGLYFRVCRPQKSHKIRFFTTVLQMAERHSANMKEAISFFKKDARLRYALFLAKAASPVPVTQTTHMSEQSAQLF